MTSENTFRFNGSADGAPAGDQAQGDSEQAGEHLAAQAAETGLSADTKAAVDEQMRDIAEVPAIEVITTSAVHLMSAAAVKCGLADGPDAEELKDLDEARKLITALAGFVSAASPEIGSQHAAPLRDGLRTLQLAFREASPYPDRPGQGPGEKFTGPVYG
ncbi:DUF1844 domain-containing protein [Kocuria coralli]|nr:DUF1844 domain-containing protein [Kocuria coralli]